MQTVKFRLKDGSLSESIKGVMLLEAEDLYPHFSLDNVSVSATSIVAKSKALYQASLDSQATLAKESHNTSADCSKDNKSNKVDNTTLDTHDKCSSVSPNHNEVKDSPCDSKTTSTSLTKTSTAEHLLSQAVAQEQSVNKSINNSSHTSLQNSLQAETIKENCSKADSESIDANLIEEEQEKQKVAQEVTQAITQEASQKLIQEDELAFVEGVELSTKYQPRSFASMQLRAKNAMRALLQTQREHLMVLCSSAKVDGIALCYDLVLELTKQEATIAYAPTKFELFGSDKEDGLLTIAQEETLNIVIMPCVHLCDHPKWLGMLDACLSQNPNLKLILCGDATDISNLSILWPTLESAIHSDVVLGFPVESALERIASLISYYQVKDHELLPFSMEAIALLASYCCRISGDRRYIALPELKLQSLIYEAMRYTNKTRANTNQDKPCFVSRHHMLKALAAQDFRTNFLAEADLRDHRDRQLLVTTKGMVVGQINGLSVIETIGSSYEYGEPVRITATLRAGGEGDVIDIERKAELAGQIHAKAMMIINGFLTKEFGAEQPLPVSASLVFEQSYSEVDGDSASLTGLCAVLSGLANVPIRQDIAVTGAVDQFGDVQAVGGVNEKIEGFFKVCRLHGLTGTQGVIIPSSCVHQLVLKPAVIKAVTEGKFHIFTVSHVTEAMKLLTTLDWGNSETENTICYCINERLTNIVAGAQTEHWYDYLLDKALELKELVTKKFLTKETPKQ